MVTVAEDLLLLALDDAKGTVSWTRSSVGYSLAGALLVDLALQGRVRLDGKYIAVADATPTGEPLLDEALAMMIGSAKPRNAKHWVGAFGKIKRLRDRIADRLVERGVLRREAHKTLGLFAANRYPAADQAPELALRERLRAAALATAEPAARDLALLSLAKTSEVLDSILPKGERRQAKKRIDALIKATRTSETPAAAASAAAAVAADAAAAVAIAGGVAVAVAASSS